MYAQDFSKPELAGLRQMEADDLCQEIAMLRVVINRMLKLAGTEQDIELAAKAVNSLATVIGALNKSMRTQTHLARTSSLFDEALMGALQDEPFYTDGSETIAKEQKWIQENLLNC